MAERSAFKHGHTLHEYQTSCWPPVEIHQLLLVNHHRRPANCLPALPQEYPKTLNKPMKAEILLFLCGVNHECHPSGWHSLTFLFRLSTQSETLNELTVASDVDISQVTEKTATLTHEQQQTTT